MEASQLENILAGTLAPDPNMRKLAELELDKVRGPHSPRPTGGPGSCGIFVLFGILLLISLKPNHVYNLLNYCQNLTSNPSPP